MASYAKEAAKEAEEKKQAEAKAKKTAQQAGGGRPAARWLHA